MDFIFVSSTLRRILAKMYSTNLLYIFFFSVFYYYFATKFVFTSSQLKIISVPQENFHLIRSFFKNLNLSSNECQKQTSADPGNPEAGSGSNALPSRPSSKHDFAEKLLRHSKQGLLRQTTLLQT